MCALLPTTSYWSKIRLPHLTLVYAGQIPEVSPSTRNELLKAAISISQNFGPQTIATKDFEVFGVEDLVDVITLDATPDILAMRKILLYWNVSEHEFSPHVTVGPIGTFSGDIPETITFDRVLVAWGNEQTSYKLQG
jgi:2'-5' RNA ligase